MERALRSMKIETPVLPPLVVDALVQTDRLLSKDESCQTDKLEKADFEIQVDMQPEKEKLSTIKKENLEIGMPNKPSSSGPKHAKKRKIPESIPSDSSDDSEDDEEAQEDQHDPGDEPRSDSKNGSEISYDEKRFLDSAAYKISRHENPEKALSISAITKCYLSMDFAERMAKKEGTLFIIAYHNL